MIQWIITIVIVAAAFFYAGYLIYKKYFAPKAKQPDDCNSCSSDCSECPMASNIEYKIKNPGEH